MKFRRDINTRVVVAYVIRKLANRLIDALAFAKGPRPVLEPLSRRVCVRKIAFGRLTDGREYCREGLKRPNLKKCFPNFLIYFTKKKKYRKSLRKKKRKSWKMSLILPWSEFRVRFRLFKENENKYKNIFYIFAVESSTLSSRTDEITPPNRFYRKYPWISIKTSHVNSRSHEFWENIRIRRLTVIFFFFFLRIVYEKRPFFSKEMLLYKPTAFVKTRDSRAYAKVSKFARACYITAVPSLCLRRVDVTATQVFSVKRETGKSVNVNCLASLFEKSRSGKKIHDREESWNTFETLGCSIQC